MISDILDALKAWPTWKQLMELPEQVAALERRIAALEAAHSTALGLPCPACGQRTFRVTASRKSTGPFGDLGMLERDYRCTQCGFCETRNAEN